MITKYEETRDPEVDFLVELIDEVVFFLNKLGTEDTQPMRRAFCRSVLQFVDGVATDLKQQVSTYESPELIGDDTYLALQNKKRTCKEGIEKIIKDRPGFAKNIRFAFDVYGWTAGADLDLAENPRDWQRFLRCISVRNRVVHPKNRKDLEISNSEVIDMLELFIWLKEMLIYAHSQVGTSWLRQAETLKSAFERPTRTSSGHETTSLPNKPLEPTR